MNSIQTQARDEHYLPRVTILTAAYNAALFLTRYLTGLDAQCYGNLEIVFIDDGSTDGTGTLIEQELRSLDIPSERWIVLRQSNQGPHVAMNLGLTYATGELILPVDADDMLLPGAVEAFVKCFVDNPDASLVYADFRRCDEKGTPVPVPTERKQWVKSEHLLYALLSYGMFIPSGAYCYRRHCLEFLPNKCFTPSLHAQNLELLLHTAANAHCVYTPVETVELLTRNNSRSHAKSLERLHRKVTGSHRLQREVAERYCVPRWVRRKLESRLLPLELDYYFLVRNKRQFWRAWVKATALRVGTRKNWLQAVSLLLPTLRSRIISRYFANYDLTGWAVT